MRLEPPGLPWWHSHAALPAVESVDHTGCDVVFSVRDASGRSHAARGRLRGLGERQATLAVEASPILTPGALGAFDDSGVTTSCLVRDGARRFLYYTGWTRGVTVPFYLFVGLAVSAGDGAPFERLSAAPVLERNAVDPFLTASPWVLLDAGRWRMWYVSADRWESTSSGPRHFYHIRYAESADGLSWRREGHVCIDFATSDEHAFGRPCVVRDGDVYRMWYSFRGEAYRIGYAESPDGITWTRLDGLAGIDVSGAGWDSEMVTYPVVFEHERCQYLLYNGNDYGRTGMGLAMRASSEGTV